MPRDYNDSGNIERRDERRLDHDDIGDEELPICPACVGGDVFKLGVLGALAHYRCRTCGCTFSC